MRPVTREELGLPGGPQARSQLLYSLVAEKVIVHHRIKTDAGWIGSLYQRSLDETVYQPVAVPESGHSFESPAMASGAPIVFLLVMHTTVFAGGSGSTYRSLARLDLSSGTMERRQPSLVDGRTVFLHQLLCVDSAGSRVVCEAAVSGADSGAMRAHYLARIDWESEQVKLLSELKGGFV